MARCDGACRPAAAQAAGRVQLELVGDAQGAALVFQQWLQVLGAAGVNNVRIRSDQGTDKVGIETRGTPENPTYVVTGKVQSADELLLPSGRFRRGDVARLARWLDDLGKYGPSGPKQEETVLGLDAAQFQQLHEDLARPVDFSTQGMLRSEVVRKIAGRLSLPVEIEPQAAAALGQDKIAEDLTGLSCGCALAYVLRPVGLCLVPRRGSGGPSSTVTESRPGLKIWPVGWELKGNQREILPAMMEFHNVNIDGVPVTTALEAFGKLLKTPVLIDHNALARHGIDPAKAKVSHPSARTMYGKALQRILFQAGLKSEVRLDEADKPFLWVSTIKPM